METAFIWVRILSRILIKQLLLLFSNSCFNTIKSFFVFLIWGRTASCFIFACQGMFSSVTWKRVLFLFLFQLSCVLGFLILSGGIFLPSFFTFHQKIDLPLLLALVSLPRQLHFIVRLGLLYFSFYSSFVLGVVCKVRRVEFNEKKVDFCLFYAEQCLQKIRTEKNKMHSNGSLTLLVMKLSVPIELCAGQQICQVSYSMFSSGLLWHQRGEKRGVAEK